MLLRLVTLASLCAAAAACSRDGGDAPEAAAARPRAAGCLSAPGGSRWAAAGGSYARGPVYGREPDGWLSGVTGVAATQDGRVAVLDGASSRVVVLDDSLRARGEFGRRGKAPGELSPSPMTRLPSVRRTFNHLAASDSELYVFDGDAVEVFGWDGRFRRQVGGLGRARSGVFTLLSMRAAPGELVYGFDTLDLAGRKGRRLQTWAVSGGRRRVVAELPLAAPAGGRGTAVMGSRQARALWAAWGNCVLMSDGAGEWVVRLDRESARSDTLPLPRHEVPPYRPSDDDALARRLTAVMGGRGAGVGSSAGTAPTALTRWSEMVVDPDGYLWIRPWRAPSDDAAPIGVVRLDLRTGRAERERVPAFPRAFGPPGTYYALEKDPETDEILLASYQRRAGSR